MFPSFQLAYSYTGTWKITSGGARVLSEPLVGGDARGDAKGRSVRRGLSASARCIPISARKRPWALRMSSSKPGAHASQEWSSAGSSYRYTRGSGSDVAAGSCECAAATIVQDNDLFAARRHVVWSLLSRHGNRPTRCCSHRRVDRDAHGVRDGARSVSEKHGRGLTIRCRRRTGEAHEGRATTRTVPGGHLS
jgi:hypothetical protein